MLDLKFIRENTDLVKKGAKDKRFTVDIDLLLALDQELRPIKAHQEKLQAERNSISKDMATAEASARETLKRRVGEIKVELEDLTKQVKDREDKIYQLLLLIPQPASKDVPIGKDDSENLELRKVGSPPKFDFKALDHIELSQKLNLVDFERGTKIAGARSYVLTGDGALLEQAVLRFTYDFLVSRNYKPMSVPVLVTEKCMEGTGYFPIGRDQAYQIEKDQLALVGTAEVPLCSYFSDEVLDFKTLPQRVMALSGAFRREAGSYGKDTKGLYRVHQFQKIEQVIIAPASLELDQELHRELLKNAEDILQALELPYRVVYVCTGDLGQGQVRKHDIETWMPGRGNYGETHSCSSFYDFQARRLNIRYKDPEGQRMVAYTLNNTAIASPRILIPLLENHQTHDGRIRIPKVLRPYLNGREFIG
jgi:seryl-tRNA synthetase